ncbi:hypothetical protein KPL26_03180 [Clostridium algidicarnis]|uniref:hypothetical protein n=1 Tax=Clostridium algidicarnis TaxID=37659 RepID=UPI001C0D880F|nr:hypothetical protein [Clostridium algidicarnis]MBU3195665.1 hypothetical protein [Clostridium algidicarnis]
MGRFRPRGNKTQRILQGAYRNSFKNINRGYNDDQDCVEWEYLTKHDKIITVVAFIMKIVSIAGLMYAGICNLLIGLILLFFKFAGANHIILWIIVLIAFKIGAFNL